MDPRKFGYDVSGRPKDRPYTHYMLADVKCHIRSCTNVDSSLSVI